MLNQLANDRNSARDNKAKKLSVVLLVAVLALSSLLEVRSVSGAPDVDFEVNINSQTLVAGANNTVTFKITNKGQSDAISTLATLTFSAGGTSGNNMMFIESNGKWSLDTMMPGEIANVSCVIYIAPSAAGTINQFTMTMTYSLSGVSNTQRVSIGVDVVSRDLYGASLSPSFSNPVLNAGQNATIDLVLENVGLRDAANISVTLNMPGMSTSFSSLSTSSLISGLTGGGQSLASGSSQFSLIGSEGKWNVDLLRKGQNISLPFTIYASPSASGTLFLFPVALTYADGLNYISETRYASVRVPSVSSPASNFQIDLSTQDFKAGDYTDLNITVTNAATFRAEAVTLQLGLPGSSLSSSSSSTFQGTTFSIPSGGSSSPFILVGDDGSWILDDMAPGESKSIPVRIFSSPSAAGSMTAFTLTTYYTDSLAKAKQESKSIGIIVRGTIDLLVLDTSTFPANVTLGKTFSISVNLINLGTSTAQSMIVTPFSNGSLNPVGSTKIFLGDVIVNVPSSFTMSFVGYNISSGVYDIPVTYTYKDSLGQRLDGALSVPIRINVSNSTGTDSMAAQSGPLSFLLASWPYIAVLAAVSAGVILFLRYRKSWSKQ